MEEGKGKWIPIEIKKKEEKDEDKKAPGLQANFKEIEKEIQIHPDYADLQNQLGLLLMMEGDQEGAEREFVLAIRLNPSTGRPPSI